MYKFLISLDDNLVSKIIDVSFLGTLSSKNVFFLYYSKSCDHQQQQYLRTWTDYKLPTIWTEYFFPSFSVPLNMSMRRKKVDWRFEPLSVVVHTGLWTLIPGLQFNGCECLSIRYSTIVNPKTWYKFSLFWEYWTRVAMKTL